MQLKTIEELKVACKAMPHLVGGLLLFTLAYISMIPMPPHFYEEIKTLGFAFGGFMLILSGMGILVLDSLKIKAN